ncbi:MAG: TspO/MBR family protein [Bacillota bacterium]
MFATLRLGSIVRLIASLAITLGAAVLGGLATASSVNTWYQSLVKPSFNPPAWVFGPVWTVLYILMGIALYLVWNQVSKGKAGREALLVFAVQLILNVLWSFAFFGLQSPLAGLIVIILLWLSIIATIRSFYEVSPTAAYLLVPYILWVSFAAVLNFSIWWLNR